MVRRPPRSTRTDTRFPYTTLFRSSDDGRLAADGGGKVSAARRVIHGPEEVLRFIPGGLHEWWAGSKLEEATINGRLGLIQHEGDAVAAAVTFAWDEDGRFTEVFIMRNPEKLAQYGKAPVIDTKRIVQGQDVEETGENMGR